ncbi:hypothetical protein [Cohaesibacter celericrescens]|uniref:hypothetical protein n=1 Tax=Cohaesibacter celericrescens TaxID=2067669 RepID=UPI0035632233
MQQQIGEQGSPQRWIFFILIAGLIAITVLFVISRILQHSGPELLNSPYSVETSLRLYTIGTTQFMVPENTVRRPEQRNLQQLKKLDLILLWPTLEGFSLDTQVAFNDVTKDSRLIFASLSQPPQPISTSERLYSVYSQHFVGDTIEGPAALIGFRMSKESGFSGEVIYFKPDETAPFVARCIKPVENTPTFCMRDIILDNGAQLNYRFRLKLLAEWRKLDTTMRSKFSDYQRR